MEVLVFSIFTTKKKVPQNVLKMRFRSFDDSFKKKKLFARSLAPSYDNRPNGLTDNYKKITKCIEP